jgi:hypothetical protein
MKKRQKKAVLFCQKNKREKCVIWEQNYNPEMNLFFERNEQGGRTLGLRFDYFATDDKLNKTGQN